jgi:hypothetical protein
MDERSEFLCQTISKTDPSGTNRQTFTTSVSFHSLQMSTYCLCMAVQAMCKEGLAAVTSFAAIGPRRRHNGRRLYAAPPTGDGFR